MKRPKLLREWVGTVCVLRCSMRTGVAELPAGSLAHVTSKTGTGVNLRSIACESCGVSVLVRGVHPRHLEPVERFADPEPPVRRR